VCIRLSSLQQPKKKKKKEEEKRKKEKEKEEYNCFLIPYASFDLQNRPLE